jgi:hypothetical protein
MFHWLVKISKETMNLIICGLKVESQQVSSDRDKVLHINYNYSYILKAGNGSFGKKNYSYIHCYIGIIYYNIYTII